jgi:hypothetical protein
VCSRRRIQESLAASDRLGRVLAMLIKLCR